jgi:hypothetical protein
MKLFGLKHFDTIMTNHKAKLKPARVAQRLGRENQLK